ncbi:hypothetical protein B5M47_02995 [candidate division CPR3 bacterium 4484_211]|uniref:ISXO2-like transposase domain-containing protein n=1 Tax=candidate division CPR3 bacterium 4484_211 TaxID=1968527 RepID=A0A1W9NZ15_UNCC3|nr:MAG: hypothetical protein B5M47_02995 [candidate division CPR3 bacterium 4484_211]
MKKRQLRKEEKRYEESKRGFGTIKRPVFGILCCDGRIFVELVNETEAKNLLSVITRKVKSGTKVCPDTWRVCTGLTIRSYVHRTVKHRKKENTKGRNHINGLEGF